MATYKLIEVTQAFNSFDDILDVRSPAEYADDHIPGAISVPVLNDEERVRIGSLYKQVSPFEAKKLGAALIAHNIACHLEEQFGNRPKSWRPLVYCWRGGMRSRAMAHILAQVGWNTAQLEGGYRGYRRHVIKSLEALPNQFDFCIISGGTGSGKSHLLHALAEQGAQVLDLEGLAQHRGSLLGRLPDQSQPSQKTFETRLWNVLRTFTPDRPVYIEAESRKVGRLSLPNELVDRMRASPCVCVDAPQAARIKLLMEDYVHFLHNPSLLIERLSWLVETHGREVVSNWCELARQGEWELLVGELLTRHYDPAYKRSSGVGCQLSKEVRVLSLSSLNSEFLRGVAEDLIRNERQNND